MSNGDLAITGKISKMDAAKNLIKYTGEIMNIPFLQKLESDFVRFGFAPENIEDMHGENCWYAGAKESKGAMPIWVYRKGS